MNVKEDYTTIRILKTVRDNLKLRGTKGDSYDDIITALFGE